MMKKLMIAACAIVTLTFGLKAAEEGVYNKTIAITATGTVYTNVVTLGDNTYKDVVKIVVNNATTVTASVVTAVEDAGGWTTIDTSAPTTGALTTAYPIRAVTSGTITNIAYIPAAKLRQIITLSGTNGVAAATGVKICVYSK